MALAGLMKSWQRRAASRPASSKGSTAASAGLDEEVWACMRANLA